MSLLPAAVSRWRFRTPSFSNPLCGMMDLTDSQDSPKQVSCLRFHRQQPCFSTPEESTVALMGFGCPAMWRHAIQPVGMLPPGKSLNRDKLAPVQEPCACGGLTAAGAIRQGSFRTAVLEGRSHRIEPMPPSSPRPQENLRPAPPWIRKSGSGDPAGKPSTGQSG